MANPFAGEVTVRIDGVDHVAKLTLGSLAGLEAAMEVDSLMQLVNRFESGAFSSKDVLAVLVAGLRGGGWSGSQDQLVSADIAGGPLGAARAAAKLLARAFHIPAE